MKEETVTVYESKSFDSLPKETQKMIKSLSDDFNVKQLNVFNPLVEAMATIEGFTDLTYKPDDDECIEQYKESKKFFGSFNSSTKKTKQKLKKPILETGRKLDKIERTFLERAKEIWEGVDKEFKPYLDEKEEKKAEADAKKNKASIDKINELSEQSVEQTLIIERSKVYKKYSDANQQALEDTLKKVETYSEMALNQELTKLIKQEFKIPDEELNILLVDQVETLSVSYESMKKTCIRMINMRLSEIINDKEKSAPTPEASTVDFNVKSTEKPLTFGQAFTEIMNRAVEDIKLLQVSDEKETQAKQSCIGGLQGYTLKILNYLSDE